MAQWCQHALGMELDAMDRILLMAQAHDVAIGTNGCHLQAVGEVVFAHYPTVVAPHLEVFRQTLEDGVVAKLLTVGRHTVIDLGEVDELTPEDLSDSLMAETHAEHRLLAGIGADDIQQQARLRRNVENRRSTSKTEDSQRFVLLAPQPRMAEAALQDVHCCRDQLRMDLNWS